jgi:putative spermidine/putrescine transport system ATP-binding protein
MPGRQAIAVTVLSIVYMGPTLEVRAQTPRGDALVAHIPNNAEAEAGILVPGSTVHACFRLDDCVFFT